MRLTSLKTLIKADTKKMLTEDWGGSDEGVLLNSMHKDLRNPHKYYQKYFPVFYKGMKELFS